ncbi:phosphatase PAP2 family protein [uncultured Phycicoccus sp.]|uniref:phosphatase PAP2 family protein n=1 Tax=uncultured Phycicoccus sp. TaxID=661422 RepID=UPI0026258BCE|nr:phosphatase PAP2 family protein [uncultured Phycicoccus sp.]
MDRPGRPPAPHGLPVPRHDEEHIGARDLADWPTVAGRWLVLLVTVAATRLARLVGWGRDNLALVVTAFVGGALVLVLDLLAAKVYDAVLDQEGLETLDRPVLDAMVALRTPGADAAVGAFTDLGGIVGMSILAVALTGALAVVRRSWTPVLLMAMAAAGSVLMTIVGKDLIGRSRPPVTLAVPPLESSPSFPSGHTLNATVLIGMLAYLALLGSARVWLRWLVVVSGVLFVVSMGLSRVYLGHHWLTDVVAGWLLGLGWLATVVTAHRVRATLRRSGQPPSTAARPASSRATGTRNGEHDT